MKQDDRAVARLGWLAVILRDDRRVLRMDCKDGAALARSPGAGTRPAPGDDDMLPGAATTRPDWRGRRRGGPGRRGWSRERKELPG